MRFEVPLQLHVMHVSLATQVTQVLPGSVLPLLVSCEAGARIEVFVTLVTLVNLFPGVYSIDVLAEVAPAHLGTTNVALRCAWVAAEAVACQSLASVEGFLAHLTSEGGGQAETVPVVYLDVRVQRVHGWANSAAVLAGEVRKVWVVVHGVVVQMGHAGESEGACRALQFPKSMAPLVLPGAGFQAEPPLAHPAREREQFGVARPQVCVQTGGRAAFIATRFARRLVLANQPTLASPPHSTITGLDCSLLVSNTTAAGIVIISRGI